MNNNLLAALQARKQAAGSPGGPAGAAAAAAAAAVASEVGGVAASASKTAAAAAAAASKPSKPKTPLRPADSALPFVYDEALDAYLWFAEGETADSYQPKVVDDQKIWIPLAPCVYRMTDYTLAKKEPLLRHRCLLKLGVLRSLQRECANLNQFLQEHYDNNNNNALEETELGKTRFMELVSSCGVYQKVSELIVRQMGQLNDPNNKSNNSTNIVPTVVVDHLEDFLAAVDRQTPSLEQARSEIASTQTVSFFPGLGELFCPGSKLVCFPDGMEGHPLGCSCVQAWYTEELNPATQKIKRKFVLVLEFIISVGDELVFVAASDVYPEFHDATRNQPTKDLKHRRLDIDNDNNEKDQLLFQKLQQRGNLYASVATGHHYLEYYPDSLFPIMANSGWSSHAVRPLSKGGRIMVDVKRGIVEGHIPVRRSGTSSAGDDGLADTVKEAIKLFDQSKRTGVAVPFRTCRLNLSTSTTQQQKQKSSTNDADRPHLWQAWPMVTGFSFTARVWGKLLLGLPKKLGQTGNCGYIAFQEKAFDQLVLADDKKELIRAVARNAGSSQTTATTQQDNDNLDDDDDDWDDDLDIEDHGIDVVANKGGASIFLLHGPPGCGKTLTAEAIAELLRKPLYIVTAGDLGITASEVEKTLGAVLDLCQTWDALVLIDEADVFLEARTSTEIQRNALVCVMLRLLEYYSGCLFLSSNRAAHSIDAAIASRITVMLGYPPLDAHGRAQVWRNLVQLVPVLPSDSAKQTKILARPRVASKYRQELTDDDYRQLASAYELNGRQIKNSIVLARALARERGTPLAVPILHRAVAAVAGEANH